MEKVKIAVIGSISVDWTVVSDRIPLKGETLTGHDLKITPGGKGANQAVAMAKLGADVTMFGCTGCDDAGNFAVKNLQSWGIDTSGIRRLEDVPNGIALIIVGGGDNAIVVVPGANGKVDRPYIDEIKDRLGEFDMVVLQHEIPIDTVHYAVQVCDSLGVPVTLNPAPAYKVPDSVIDKVSYLTPNEHEAKLIFGDMDRDTLLKKYPEKLIITLGEEGVVTALKSGEILHIPAIKTRVVDTTGAGDTLNGAFCYRIAKKDCIKDALLFANAASSLSIRKMGAQGGLPTEKEVKELLQKEN